MDGKQWRWMEIPYHGGYSLSGHHHCHEIIPYHSIINDDKWEIVTLVPSRQVCSHWNLHLAREFPATCDSYIFLLGIPGIQSLFPYISLYRPQSLKKHVHKTNLHHHFQIQMNMFPPSTRHFFREATPPEPSTRGQAPWRLPRPPGSPPGPVPPGASRGSPQRATARRWDPGPGPAPALGRRCQWCRLAENPHEVQVNPHWFELSMIMCRHICRSTKIYHKAKFGWKFPLNFSMIQLQVRVYLPIKPKWNCSDVHQVSYKVVPPQWCLLVL